MVVIGTVKHENCEIRLIEDRNSYRVMLKRLDVWSSSDPYENIETAYTLFCFMLSDRPIEGCFWADPLVKKNPFYFINFSKSPKYIQGMILRGKNG